MFAAKPLATPRCDGRLAGVGARRPTAIATSGSCWLASRTTRAIPSARTIADARTPRPSSGCSPLSRCSSLSSGARSPAARDRQILCTPGRRSRGSGCAGRSRARSSARSLFEGWAADAEEAERWPARGADRLRPCHHHGAVGPMAGVVSRRWRSWWSRTRRRAPAPTRRSTRASARSCASARTTPTVLERLRWMRDCSAPAFCERRCGRRPDRPASADRPGAADGRRGPQPQPRRHLAVHPRRCCRRCSRRRPTAEARPRCSTSCAATTTSSSTSSMAACKAALDAAHGVAGSTVVTAMARNGVDFGVRMSGTGDRWFTAPVGVAGRPLLPGLRPGGRQPRPRRQRDHRDGRASAASPWRRRRRSSASSAARPADALAVHPRDGRDHARPRTRVRLPAARLPRHADRHRRPPRGRASASRRSINTGIAHREAGVGQIGAGLVRPPMEQFVAATRALAGTG